MKYLNIFKALFNNHTYEESEQFLKDKVTTLNVIIIALSVIVFSFSIIRYIRAEYTQFIADIVFTIVLLIGFYFLRKDKKYLLLISRFLIFFATSISLVLIIVLPEISTRFAWLYLATYTIFYLLDLKEGALWFTGMLGVIFSLFFTNIIDITLIEFLVLIVTILFLAFFLIQYELIKYKSQEFLLNYAHTLEKTVAEKVVELQEQKDTFEYLFQKSYDGTLLIEDGKFVKCNDAIVKMLWYSDADELLNMSIIDISPEYQDDGELSVIKADKMIQKCLEKGAHNFEWILQASLGVDFWCDITLTHLKVKNRSIIHTVVRDITDKKELEKENTKVYENLEEKVFQRTEELEIAIRAKGDFLANMSHEIRTPLNAILGFISILKKNEDDTKKLKYFDIIYTSGHSLLGIINDILDFSKIENQKLELEHEKFPTIQPFEEIFELLDEKAKEKNIEFLLNINSQLPKYVLGDTLRIKQIFSNLISNAIKFTSQDGCVRADISYDYRNSQLHCSVSDTGIGIEQGHLAKIFDAFSQADSSTTRKFGGTGLGLSISKHLVQLMNGTIEAKSILDEGSIFTFAIELKADEESI